MNVKTTKTEIVIVRLDCWLSYQVGASQFSMFYSASFCKYIGKKHSICYEIICIETFSVGKKSCPLETEAKYALITLDEFESSSLSFLFSLLRAGNTTFKLLEWANPTWEICYWKLNLLSNKGHMHIVFKNK